MTIEFAQQTLGRKLLQMVREQETENPQAVLRRVGKSQAVQAAGLLKFQSQPRQGRGHFLGGMVGNPLAQNRDPGRPQFYQPIIPTRDRQQEFPVRRKCGE